MRTEKIIEASRKENLYGSFLDEELLTTNEDYSIFTKSCKNKKEYKELLGNYFSCILNWQIPDVDLVRKIIAIRADYKNYKRYMW